MFARIPSTTTSKIALRVALAAAMLALLLAGCVTVPDDFKQPGISVIAIQPRVINSMTPEFDIRLRVTNPNRKALEIAGLSYELRLAGSKVIEGVASDLPRIEAYGEAEVMLRAHADLLGSLGVLSRMINDPDMPVDYEFGAEIDLGTFYPTLKIERSGTLSP